MAVFNARFEFREKDRNGNIVSITPKEGLWLRGPRVQVTLSQIETQITALADKGEIPAPPVAGWAPIDTGATMTCVDRTAAQRAGLACVDTGLMSSTTHASELVPIFSGRINIEGVSRYVDSLRAYGANLGPLGLIALIGRDLLASCVLVYNGLDGSFSLSI